ncbi:MDR family MFS transporter [Alteribacter natronophilus]|uniref:MDR family MFS transporter n=1 Tax=Alteribacter natronophilus TaxID=2583810 RepID=UPI00110EC381|nr:MFS transporter [Alteribacter natronophilus]TMW71796.1 MFS transporter [Alteribacter natronophilus]
MPKAVWLLVIGMAINVTGASFLWPLNTIYIHVELGMSLTVAGIVIMGNAVMGIIGNLIGGKLFDRIGGYRTIILGVVITMASAFILAVFNDFYQYVILMLGLGFGAGIIIPAMYAMAGAVWPEGGRRPFNAMYVAQNIGVSVGAASGGLLASYRFDLVFLGNGLMYLSFFILALLFFRHLQADSASAAATNVFEQSQEVENRKRFKALLILCGGFLICWIAYVQWQTTISAHTQTLGIPLTYYSILWTINGAMIVFCQPIIKLLIGRWVHSLKAQIYVGLVIFMCAYLVLSQAEVYAAFVVAMVILTFGEMFVWPAVPTIAHQLAPEGKAGFYQGIVNSIGTGGRMIGPFFGGVMADLFGMTALFYVLVVLFLVGFVTTSLYDRALTDERIGRRDMETA